MSGKSLSLSGAEKIRDVCHRVACKFISEKLAVYSLSFGHFSGFCGFLLPLKSWTRIITESSVPSPSAFIKDFVEGYFPEGTVSINSLSNYQSNNLGIPALVPLGEDIDKCTGPNYLIKHHTKHKYAYCQHNATSNET